MRLILTFFDPNGMPVESRRAEPGDTIGFSFISPYLVSAGQAETVSVAVYEEQALLMANWQLIDARHLTRFKGGEQIPLIQVPITWDVSFLPTRRLLADILEDVVQHGINNPEHGIGCICMDKAAREIRLQMSKAIPPDGRTTDSDWSQPIQDRLTAKARIRYVLEMVVRGF